MWGWVCGTDCTARKRSRWDAIIASVLSALILSPLDAFAADVTPVHFAGFAYVGDDAATTASYPNTRRIEAERVGDISVLDDALRRHLQGFSNPSFTLQFGSLASLKAGPGSATVLAFALDRESTSVEQIGNKHKLVTELSAQALFVDFREMAVVATFPIVVQGIDVLDAPPTSEEIALAVRNLYLGDGKANIFAAFTAALAATHLNPTIERRVRVVDATITDGARAAMPALSTAASGVAESALAQDFSKFLSVNQRIPVLPPAKGHAIGNRMAARFADGTVYNLSIPEADYAIYLRLDELKRVDYASNAAGRSLIYGAFMQVRVDEPLTGKVFFDARLRNGATKSVPASQQNIDDSAAYQDALLALMDKFTVALTDSDPAWAEKHAGDRAVAKQMKQLEKVLQSCR
jgi:hypothetical protein